MRTRSCWRRWRSCSAASTRDLAEKKKKAKIKAKERMRVALGLQGQDEEGATGASEMDLFSLARIKSKGGLDAVQNAAAPGLDAARDSDDDIAEMDARRGAYDDSTIRRRRGRPRRRASGGGTRSDVARVRGATHQEGRAVRRAE